MTDDQLAHAIGEYVQAQSQFCADAQQGWTTWAHEGKGKVAAWLAAAVDAAARKSELKVHDDDGAVRLDLGHRLLRGGALEYFPVLRFHCNDRGDVVAAVSRSHVDRSPGGKRLPVNLEPVASIPARDLDKSWVLQVAEKFFAHAREDLKGPRTPG